MLGCRREPPHHSFPSHGYDRLGRIIRLTLRSAPRTHASASSLAALTMLAPLIFEGIPEPKVRGAKKTFDRSSEHRETLPPVDIDYFV